MITITELINNADVEAAFDIVEQLHARGNVSELIEGQRALIAKLKIRRELRKLQLQEILADRFLKGAVVKLANHADIPLSAVVGITVET